MRMSKWFFPLLRSGGRNIPPMFTQSWALKTLCRTRSSLSCGLETLISPSHISYPQSLILDRRPIEIPASSFTTALHYLQCKCRFSSLTDIHNHYLIWEVTWQLVPVWHEEDYHPAGAGEERVLESRERAMCKHLIWWQHQTAGASNLVTSGVASDHWGHARGDPVCEQHVSRLHHRAGHPGQAVIQEAGQEEAEKLSSGVGVT